MPLSLAGSRVLVTGATGGIGHAIARSLHAKGASVVLTGRRAEVLDELSSELGERVEVLTADLADAGGMQSLAERAGDVDVLVANAGLSGTGRLDDYTPEEIDRVLDVNLRAPVQLTRALLPGMKARGRGHLVYISSTSGKMATAQASLYNATKFGLRGFSFALWEELKGTGVGATAIFPGLVSEAGIWAESGLKNPRGVGARSPSQVAAAVVRGIETGRAEIDVAPFIARFGGWLAGPAPGLVSLVTRRFGGEEVAASLAEATRDKR
jgi:short-subunit dehydrogenase